LTIDGVCLLSIRRRSEKLSAWKGGDNMPYEVIEVDCGDEVICDLCNESFTESEEIGGCAIGTWAICPKCAGKLKEEPDQRCGENETFRDFVYRLRKQ